MKLHLREQDLLGPLTDGQAEHLHTCVRCRQRQANHEQVRNAIRRMEREAPPASGVTAMIARAGAPARSGFVFGVATAGAAVLVAVVGMLCHSHTPLPAPLVDELALDHLHYEHRPDAAVVTGPGPSISTWFLANLGFTPHMGAIEATTIEGAKPCRIAGRWTALVWLERAGHWLSVFTMPEQVAYGRGCAKAQGVSVCASPDPRGGARVVVGDLSEGELLRIVDESLR